MLMRALLVALPLVVIGCGGKSAASAVASPTVTDAEPSASWEAAGIDWSTPPAPLPETTFSPPVATELRLRNGLRVLVIASNRLPLVSISLVNPLAGSTSDPKGKAGLALLVADLLDEGAGKRNAVELAAELDRLGATLELTVDHDAAYVELNTLSRTFEPSLALLADVLAQPQFAPAEIVRVRAEQLEAVRRRVDEPTAVAALVTRQVLYGRDGAYGSPIGGRVDSLERITRADVVGFYQQHWAPNVATLVIAGDVDATKIAAQLEATVGAAWQSKARAKPPRPPTPIAKPPRLVLVDRDGAEQSVIFVARVGLARTDPRLEAAEVMNTILGGSFTSRLNDRLREQLGYTYSAYSSFVDGRAAGPWRASSAMFTKVTQAGVGEMLSLIRGLASKPLAEEEISRARQLLIAGVPTLFATNEGTAEAFTELALYELPLDWYRNYAQRIEGVSAPQAQTLAAELLNVDDLVVVVVGDLDAIRDELLQLDLGSTIQLDATGSPVTTH